MSAYASAFVLKDSLFTLGGTSFANALMSATLKPDQPVQTQRTLVPDGLVVDVDSVSWTFSIKALQSHEDDEADLAAYLNANAGEIVTAVYAPQKGTGKMKHTFQVMCVSVDIGGDQGSWAQFETELPVQGGVTPSAQA